MPLSTFSSCMGPLTDVCLLFVFPYGHIFCLRPNCERRPATVALALTLFFLSLTLSLFLPTAAAAVP